MLYWWPRQQPTGTTVPQAADVRATISNDYLSRAVEQHLGGASILSVSNVRITSVPPNALTARADVGAGPFTAPVSLELQPVASGGQIEVKVISSSIAGLPVPSQLIQLVANQINGTTRSLIGARAQVTGVRVRPQGLQVYVNYPS